MDKAYILKQRIWYLSDRMLLSNYRKLNDKIDKTLYDNYSYCDLKNLEEQCKFKQMLILDKNAEEKYLGFVTILVSILIFTLSLSANIPSNFNNIFNADKIEKKNQNVIDLIPIIEEIEFIILKQNNKFYNIEITRLIDTIELYESTSFRDQEIMTSIFEQINSMYNFNISKNSQNQYLKDLRNLNKKIHYLNDSINYHEIENRLLFHNGNLTYITILFSIFIAYFLYSLLSIRVGIKTAEFNKILLDKQIFKIRNHII